MLFGGERSRLAKTNARSPVAYCARKQNVFVVPSVSITRALGESSMGRKISIAASELRGATSSNVAAGPDASIWGERLRGVRSPDRLLEVFRRTRTTRTAVSG